MKLGSPLPFMAAVVLLVTPLPAQQNLPASTQARIVTMAHIDAMSQSELRELFSQAQAGDREAQYRLALVYMVGLLVPKDFAVSRSWMRKSAEQGYVPAQAGMGETYLYNITYHGAIPDFSDADRWLRMAATQGDADAQLWLGHGYRRGWFGAFDDREALKWLRKAAAQGLPWAQWELGQMYEEGEGVPQSDSLAASWYRKAADHLTYAGGVPMAGGVREAAIELAYMYRDGRLPRDYVEAYMWFVVRSFGMDTDDDDVKWAAQHMTKTQLAQAQRRTQDWIKRHTAPPENVASAKP